MLQKDILLHNTHLTLTLNRSDQETKQRNKATKSKETYLQIFLTPLSVYFLVPWFCFFSSLLITK